MRANVTRKKDSLHCKYGVVYTLFYGRIRIPRNLGNIDACADSVYQALFSPPTRESLGTRLVATIHWTKFTMCNAYWEDLVCTLMEVSLKCIPAILLALNYYAGWFYTNRYQQQWFVDHNDYTSAFMCHNYFAIVPIPPLYSPIPSLIRQDA